MVVDVHKAMAVAEEFLRKKGFIVEHVIGAKAEEDGSWSIQVSTSLEGGFFVKVAKSGEVTEFRKE